MLWNSIGEPSGGFVKVISVKIMTLKTSFPGVLFYQFGMAGSGLIVRDFGILMAIHAESWFDHGHTLVVVFSMAIVAFVRPEAFSLLSETGFHETRNRMPVVWAIVTVLAYGIVHRRKSDRHHFCSVQAEEAAGIVTQLLSYRPRSFFVTGVAGEFFVGGVHGPQGLESNGRGVGPQSHEKDGSEEE